MTKLEILEGNKLIANFMGWKFHKKAKWYDFSGYAVDCFENPESIGATDVEKLKFHYSWDWLMSVRTEIEHTGFRFSLFSCEEHCVVEFTDMAIPGKSIVKIKSYNYNNIIEVVYEAIIKFIKWYNDNPNKSLNHE